MKRILPLFLALSIAPVVYAAPEAAPAVTEPSATIDPAASALIAKSAAAYKALNGLSMHFSTSNGEAASPPGASGELSFQRPDKARSEFVSGARKTIGVADGKHISMIMSPTSYRVDEATGPDAMLVLLSQIPSTLNMPFPTLVGGGDLLNQGHLKWESVTLLPDNGVKLFTHVAEEKIPYTCSLYFDPTDSLLRRVEVEVTSQDKTTRNITTITDVKANPTFAPGTFVFTPPADSKLYVEPPMYDPKLVVGAKPYPLKGLDLNGKAHTWNEFKGKVVLLDFWATWCGPCVEELPNVFANYKTYHPKGMEIIGVSLDSDKKALTDFIAAKDMKYPNLFDGKGWQNVDGKTYGVQAIPFSLLIGKDGKIAAVNPRGELLAPAIKKALAAK